MNDLQQYFEENTGYLIDKWMHYFAIYDRHFARFRDTDVHVLEIGVSHGGSLQMWKSYFGQRARIFGVDINPHCAKLGGDQAQIFIGDQDDKAFLRRLTREIPRIDILIDDGGHTMEQQINTFDVMYPHLTSDGIYLCEDLHTSYRRAYGGGCRRPGTFIEYSKELIDYLHAWHYEKTIRQDAAEFSRSTYALHYYDSILVVEKRNVEKPHHRKSGERTLPSTPMSPPPLLKRARRKLRRFLAPLLASVGVRSSPTWDR